MRHSINFKVNGESCSLEVEPQETLLEVLRERLGITSPKYGCGKGECGVCTVLLNGEPVNSCLVLAVEVDGQELTTVEGLVRDGRWHPLQEAFTERGAIQCGFCTPAMLLSLAALLERNQRPTEGEIRTAIAGNLCRCTGYVAIVEAVLSLNNRLSG
ncbi:aerobic carbon-monoxide dehydrogenase small subunit [Candidatus Hakubella thermalkaliphila]|uniref:Aerobic carbon-monoxide dehydrogenase small subunit n=1 Tax=Candidatus Hakubella thermalkaliphila TaxID=2754717 RepID=A0A6V8NWQ6_9ACTN|nr:(2Fe-2S)-binding protein [Candidatus Hakubella thermalkaliphila]GFP24617.1 aerobic carbon-monoxide dehydrogenase small subunit [Candidatus Hakubella thermalkaliphila]GFP27481.1 aerobic carbon-monoxide dehydrogenase small subunit [Candidatus Hakubella thermalkaliphila]GFP34536.1 aerobic carbon-monoxide dehydrogenase small subunit [Candidatus Hakubella thermalkaliphila]